MQIRVAIDTGGTFTDVVADLGGRLVAAKVPSTPRAPDEAIRAAIARVAPHTALHGLVHGTTVATNALLERRGARVGLIANAGFTDLLDVGRQARDETDLYALQPRPRPVLVAPGDRIGVSARRGPRGEVLAPLDESALRVALRSLDAAPRSWVVCLLHAWADDSDEVRVAHILAEERPGDDVTLSAALLREAREVERAETAVANAFVRPALRTYLSRLEGLAREVSVMGSAGGHLALDAAAAEPVHTALSGPAGGAVAAAALADALGLDGVISFDMGGTSTDVALATRSLPVRSGARVGDFGIHVPILDIHTVGAGGGSIAYLDDDGVLRVGPRSAGADPGPACYGRGVLPTVTDADVVLGRVAPEGALGGAVTLDPLRAHAALEPLARDAALDVEALAAGIVAVVDEAMAAAVRRISVERGVDVRRLALCAFGGAGPVHACAVAERLGVSTVVVPAHAGVFSALGMLVGAAARERVRSVLLATPAQVCAARDSLRASTEAELGEEPVRVECFAELRYRGQGHTLAVGFSGAWEDAVAAFHASHADRFGYRLDDEVVADTVRVRVEGRAAASPFDPDDAEVPGPSGPAAVDAGTHGVWIPPGWRSTSRTDGTLVLRRQEDTSASDLHDGAITPDRSRHAPNAEPDAIELAIARHRFDAVAAEMGEALMRAAFSPNIRDRRDFSCALFAADGELLAQAAHIPVHLGAAPLCVRAVAAGVDLADGETAIVNDPYAGGTHLPDITLVTAVDLGPRRFYVASRAHHADVGGIAPGSLPLSRTLADEGWCCGPSRLTPEVEASLLAASRTPLERRGDLAAQRAAARVGVAGLRAMGRELGDDHTAALAAALGARGARAAASLFASLPPTTVEVDDVIDDPAPEVASAAIRLRLRVVGNLLELDFRESDPQVDGPFNAVRAIVESAALYVVRLLLPPDTSSGSALMRHIRVLTRPGTVVDALPPAAVAAGNVETSQRLVDVIQRAFAELLPGRIPACSHGSMNNLLIGSAGPRPFAYYETIGGGHGGGPLGRGASAMQAHMTNTRNTPVEVLEATWPLRVRTVAVRGGSGGDGREPGGDGTVRELELLAPATVTLLAERRRRGAPGADGGAPGRPGRDTIVHPDGREEHVASGKFSRDLPPGTVVRVETPGGGGWGRATSSG